MPRPKFEIWSTGGMVFTPRPQPPDHVFGLATPQHMLFKLEWEIARLEECIAQRDHFPAMFVTFNAAVTAWHIVDWTWHTTSADPEVGKNVSMVLKLPTLTLATFADGICGLYREMHLFRQIANGSKHMLREGKNADTNVLADIEWHGGFDDPAMSLVIRDGNAKVPVLSALKEVAQFWYQFFEEIGLDY